MDYSELSFNDDLLQRKTFVKNLMRVIYDWNNMQHENASMSIAINSPWGSGKSYLLNIWRKALLDCEFDYGDIGIVFYDAWKSDSFDNAFIPLLYELTNLEVGTENYELNTLLKQKGKALAKHCGIAILKRQIEKVLGEQFVEEIKDILNGVEDTNVENIFEQYNHYLKMKNEFSDALKGLVPEKGKLFVFIDELDRCRPQFAIDTLEIIKHYCDIPNIVFVYAIDLQQIAYSIQSCYGQGMDSSGYLRRFFDYNVNLPNTNIDKYFEVVLGKIIHILDDRNDIDCDEIKNMFIRLEMSLRDINKINDNIIVFCSFYKDKILKYNDLNNLSTYIYFIILKYKYPEIYQIMLSDYGYMLSDNAPKNWPVIENKIFIGMKINELIKSGQTGAFSHESGMNLISRYGFPSLKSNKGTFSNHIKSVLELVR